MKKISYLLFISIFTMSILHSQLVRAGDNDKDSRHDRDRSGKDHDGWWGKGGHGGDGGGARVPLDGGISILLAAGIGLGVKKVFEKKKEGKIAGDQTGQ